MTEAKRCTKCNKPLRADNTKGICGDAMRCQARAKGVDVEAVERDKFARAAGSSVPARKVRTKALKLKTKGDAVTRFKTVADALGFDGSGILEAFALTWLEALREKAETLAAPQKSHAAPVRLRQARPVAPAPEALGAGG